MPAFLPAHMSSAHVHVHGCTCVPRSHRDGRPACDAAAAAAANATTAYPCTHARARARTHGCTKHTQAHFEYWHVHTRATDIPSAMPRLAVGDAETSRRRCRDRAVSRRPDVKPVVQHVHAPHSQLYIGFISGVDGMSVARVWSC